ncbi:MAG: hypothetical protein AB1491_04350 [Thermodesulfobacteriota bacterium]
MHPPPNPQSFDRKALKILPLAARQHDLDLSVIREAAAVPPGTIPPGLGEVARRVVQARKQGRAVILMMGAHVLRTGVQRYLIDLMSRGYLSCLAMNGGAMIHDYEFALIGATTESVARYIATGEFGLWQEAGAINDIINGTYGKDPHRGLGEAVGQAILAGDFPHKEISVLAAGARLGLPVTVHVGLGYDIIHEHPNCNGAATGQLSYNDFLKFAGVVRDLEGGVVMNFGSAVMAPEVYLKALAMARNVAHQQGQAIKQICTLVCDLRELTGDLTQEPPKTAAAYYFRPWKTMLVRTVKDGGKSFYVQGEHGETVPALWTAIHEAEEKLSGFGGGGG